MGISIGIGVSINTSDNATVGSVDTTNYLVDQLGEFLVDDLGEQLVAA